MKLTQKKKAEIFDWISCELDKGKIEILFKSDDSGDLDFDSCSSVSDLLIEFETKKL
ncbi:MULTISPECIES: hypothetical protein [Pseudoalteromonas]|uniref:hypothetical protein n=1 Tax=Pseudoalteromonas TaxID=53246 RepID=UPI001459FF9E|nr:hypothetical protein [Pseudoalteromonas sp. MEBiC 03485]